MFKNKIVLITGGTGSWGNELTTQLLEKDPKEIRIFPPFELNGICNHYANLDLKKVEFEEYSSRTFLMDKKEIKELLKEGGFIN